MRPGMLLTLAASWLVLTVMVQPMPAKTSRLAASPADPAKDSKYPILRVEGRWESTTQAAWISAEADAQSQLMDFFAREGLVLTRTPSAQDLKPLLARHWKYDVQEKPFAEPVGRTMYRIVLEVPVTPDVRGYLVQQDRQFRSQDRMILLAKVLVGFVMLLTAVAGYVYLDEWSKGYFTGWRLIIFGIVPVVVVVAMLLLA